MKYRALAALLFLGAACTANNPFFSGGGGGDGGSNNDSGIPGDGSMPGKDMRPGGTDMTQGCMPGARECVASTQASASVICEGGSFKADRVCPGGSDCAQGYCEPPMPDGSGLGEFCSTENDCSQISLELSCEPFVDPNTKEVHWFCGHRVGAGGSGAPCTGGDVCRTGFCGVTGSCIRTCVSDFDCPQTAPAGHVFRCLDDTFNVEGVTLTVSTCQLFP
jgi:hypothetical protein